MKKKLLSAVVLCTLGFMGCGDDVDENPTPSVPKFDTANNIIGYLEGKALLMEGDNIPSHPNGLDENVNFGSATQCYNKVEMKFASGNFAVTSDLGTLRNAPTLYSTGDCDRTVVSNTQSFTSNTVAIDNVKEDASCFDIIITYTGFKQVGRGNMSADGKTLTLELFFEGATGATCEAGAVGSKTVKVSGADFAGNALQVYKVSVAQ